MIESMHIENFKCFKSFDIELGKFNVLIGPNDSGKTAFLQAVRLVCAATKKGSLDLQLLAREFGLDIGANFVWRGQTEDRVLLGVKFTRGGGTLENEVVSEGKRRNLFLSTRGPTPLVSAVTGEPPLPGVGVASYYHLDPAALRRSSNIAGTHAFSMTPNGDGFPTYLEDLLRADRRAFFEMEKAFYEMYPLYDSIEIIKTQAMMAAVNDLVFKPKNGSSLGAGEVSDGALLYLAYLAITKCPSPPDLLLVEEPENGVHHASLKQIIRALREVSDRQGVQVIATTHSPYLLDLVEPEEVRVFSKDAEGAAHAAKLSDHPDVAKLRKHFMTGEIWTELDEAEIVNARERGGK